MTTWQFLSSGWDWEPSIIFGCLGLLLVYGWAVKWRFGARAISWLAGVLLLFFVLVSPLDTLGDTYLLTAHMVQHLALALFVPPLLIIGLPEAVAHRIVAVPLAGRIERVLRRPAIAWSIGLGMMAIWHTPLFFNAALSNETIHVIQHLCFLVSGSIFWWPILSPLERSRMSPVPWAAGYLFAACMTCTLIGIFITFSPVSVYPAYLQPAGSPEIVSLIRDQWGLSAKVDHQLGGLLMWTVGCTEYLVATMAMFMRWYTMPESPVLPA